MIIYCNRIRPPSRLESVTLTKKTIPKRRIADQRTAKRNNQPAIGFEQARGKDVESLTSTHGWLVSRREEQVSRKT